MKVYRFMSFKEFNKMLAGVPIVGRKSFNARTSSSGICFLPEVVKFNSSDGEEYEFCPSACFCFLNGIVSSDVLVEFETDREFQESYGIYADPCGSYYDCICIRELCIPEYDREILIPLRYCVDVAPCVKEKWYDVN